jgi:gliding motility-associated-like protein
MKKFILNMKNLCFLIAISLIGILQLNAQSLKSDDFSNNNLDNWIVVNQNPSSTVGIVNGDLQMKASIANGGSDLWSTTNHNAPRILQRVDPCGNFKVETKLKVDFSKAYQGAGIIIVRGQQANSEDEVRICHYLYRGYEFFRFISLAGLDFENPNSPGYNDLIKYDKNEIYFSLEKKGKYLIRKYSPNGTNWILMDSLYNEDKIYYVGLFAASQKWGNTPAADLVANFEYWKVVSETTTNNQTKNYNICQGESVKVGNSTYNTAGTYKDTLTTQNGCDSIITSIITLKPNSTKSLNYTICQGGSVKVGNSIYKTAGTFKDILTAKNGCDSIITTTINVDNQLEINLGNDTIICSGIELLLNINTESENILWSNGSTENFIKVSSPGIYSVSISNECGLFADSIKIETTDCDCNVFIPNAFSPNGDGKNDVFIVKEENIINSRLIIYNKWGKEVFSSNNNEQNWNGINKDKQLPPDVYGYYYEGTCVTGNKIEYKGNITIVR